MNEYHKIKTVFLRDPENNYKTLLEGKYAIPEFEYLKDNLWVWTEKVDGTNIRIMRRGINLSFGGKTNRAEIPPFLLNVLGNHFNPLVPLFEEVFDDAEVCFYGEGYGEKIQKGGKYLPKEQRFLLFDVKIGHWWLRREDVENIGQKFNLEVAPVIGKGTLPQMVSTAKAGFKSRWGEFLAEGIVGRPLVELKTRSGSRIITKIKLKDFTA